MPVRRQPVTQGLHWFVQAINLGARNPRAVFGAALLLVACIYLVLVGGAMLATVLAGGGNELNTTALAMMLVTMLALFLLVPVFIGGLMHVIREVEAGRPARARDLFQPFREGTALRLTGFGVLQVAMMLLAAGVAALLAGSEYMQAYSEVVNAAMQQQKPPEMPLPAHPFLWMLWQFAFNYFSVTIVMLGIALVALSKMGFFDALARAGRASLRNMAPNLLAAMLFIVSLALATLLITLVGSVVLLVIGMLSKALALAIGALFTLALIAAVLVVVCGGGYVIWRDTFSEAEPPPSTPAVPHQIAA